MTDATEFDPDSDVTYDPPQACEMRLNGRWHPTRIYAWFELRPGVWEADVEVPEYTGGQPVRRWWPQADVRPVTEV